MSEKRKSLSQSFLVTVGCVHAQPPRNGMFQGDTGRMASSSSSFEDQYRCWLEALWKQGMACDRVVSGLMLPLWEEVLWPFLDASDSVRPRTTSTQWNDPGRYGPDGELFFFLLENEARVLRELSRLGPSIRPHGELLLLLMQKKPTFVPDSEAFDSYIGDGFLVPELKDESEASKDEQADSPSENNVGNGHRPLLARLGGGAKVALSYHIALDMLCQELHEAERRRGCYGF